MFEAVRWYLLGLDYHGHGYLKFLLMIFNVVRCFLTIVSKYKVSQKLKYLYFSIIQWLHNWNSFDVFYFLFVDCQMDWDNSINSKLCLHEFAYMSLSSKVCFVCEYTHSGRLFVFMTLFFLCYFFTWVSKPFLNFAT